MPKYVFVTGGVVSSLGKGISAASLGLLLEARGLKVTLMKFDPYINVDPGTMNPYQHGEVFVTDDGAETDLDLGHYERFTSAMMSQRNNVTAGRVYDSVIKKERRGDYDGGTVQVVPHITDEIKRRIHLAADVPDLDVAIIEIGGTVGDIEGLPFLEALRQFPIDVGRENVVYIHVTLVPFIHAAREIKTKPTQHSVRTLREIGIEPAILLCRTERALSEDIRKKISNLCNVDLDAVIEALDTSPIYRIPIMFEERGLDTIVMKKLGIESQSQDLKEWREMLEKVIEPSREIRIAAIGKYVGLKDAYKSIDEALTHAGAANDAHISLKWFDAEEFFDKDPADRLSGYQGILVAPGFGRRGIEGKIRVIQYARENQIPFLGICLGMQCAVIEFARNVCGLTEANSTEVQDDTPDPVICLLSEQEKGIDIGGTLRRGAYPCQLREGTRTFAAYQTTDISERHRHRYEFNNNYREMFEEKGLIVAGTSPDGTLVEMIELTDHPWFVACQFHPEFRSRPINPHPLFRGFVRGAVEYAERTSGTREAEAISV